MLGGGGSPLKSDLHIMPDFIEFHFREQKLLLKYNACAILGKFKSKWDSLVARDILIDCDKYAAESKGSVLSYFVIIIGFSMQ